MFNNSSEKNRYSLRKLSVGLASVLIGISFIEANGQTAKADTVDGDNTAAISTKVKKTANGSQNTASDANKGTTASNGSLGAASADSGQESVKENGSQNYNANDSAEATTAKTEAVKDTITDTKAALDAANGAKTNASVANQANTDAKSAVNEAQTSNAKQESRGNIAQTANGGTSTSGNEPATTLLKKDAQVAKNANVEATNKASNAAIDTQIFDVTKNSKALDSKALVANLTDDKTNADWADPAKQGFHKTNAGWTQLQQGKDYDAVANSKFKVNLSGDFNYKDTAYGNITFENVTINKKDLKAGNKVLIAAIPILYDQKGSYAGYGSYYMNSWDLNKDNVRYGGFTTTNTNRNETDVYLTLSKDQKILDEIASDLTFSLTTNVSQNSWDQAGSDTYFAYKAQPLHEKIIFSDDSATSLTWHYTQNANEFGNQGSSIYEDLYSSFTNGHLFWLTKDTNTDQFKPEIIHSVFKYSDPLGNFNFNSTSTLLKSSMHIGEFNADHQYHDIVWNDYTWSNLKKLDENLSADSVYSSATSNNPFVVSKQSDGSYLVAIYVDTSKLVLSSNNIKDVEENTFIAKNSDKQTAENYVNHNMQIYQNHGYHPYRFDIWFTSGSCMDGNKPSHVTASDLTKKTNYVKANPTTYDYKPNGIDVDLSVFRTYNVQYKDAITGQIVNNDTISTQTGANVDYKIQKSDNYMLAPSQDSEIKFTVPKDEKPNPDPIVINVLGKEDYERDRTYKVIIQKPDHKGGTIDSTYATYNLKIHRDVTGRDSNGKVTFGNWEYTDSDGFVHTYSPGYNLWVSSDGPTNDLILGDAKSAPSDSDFEVLGYTAKSDIPIEGIDLPNFLNDLLSPNAKDRIRITSQGQLFLHDVNYINPDHLMPDTTYYIKYTANHQSMTYKIVDDDIKDTQGNPTQIGKDIVLTGVTDQTVQTGLKMPDHYYIANGSTMPATYTFGATNSPVLIHLKHVRDAVKDDKYLKNTSVRIITFDFPAGHGDPEIITQTIGWTRTGTYDEVTAATKGLDEAEKEGNYTDWVFTSDPTATKVTVTVNGKDDAGLASKCQAYDQQAYAKDNNDVEFAAIPIPKIPGYKAQFVQDKANPAMFFVSFMALPNTSDTTKDDNTEINNPTKPVDPSDDTKPSINVPVTPNDPKDATPKLPIAAPSVPAEVKDTQDITFDEPVEAPAVQAADLAWHIKDDAKIATYTVANAAHILSLPRFTGYTLRLVKRDAARDAISFVYVNPNKTLKYIFNIKLANGKYILTIGKVTEDGIIPLEKVTFSDYKQLIALIAKAVNR